MKSILIILFILLPLMITSCTKEGPMGPAGPTGDTGATGPIGETGETGEAGQDATIISFTGVLSVRDGSDKYWVINSAFITDTSMVQVWTSQNSEIYIWLDEANYQIGEENIYIYDLNSDMFGYDYLVMIIE